MERCFCIPHSNSPLSPLRKTPWAAYRTAPNISAKSLSLASVMTKKTINDTTYLRLDNTGKRVLFPVAGKNYLRLGADSLCAGTRPGRSAHHEGQFSGLLPGDATKSPKPKHRQIHPGSRGARLIVAAPARHTTSHLANGYGAAITRGVQSARYAAIVESGLRLCARTGASIAGRWVAVREEKSVVVVFVSSGKRQA